MYISGGVNVYPAEIENLLFQQEGVQDAAVLGVPDPKWGEAGVAFVVARGGSGLSQEAVLGFLNSKLARYKVPKAVIFRESLPRTPYGKVVKSELGEWYRQRQSK